MMKTSTVDAPAFQIPCEIWIQVFKCLTPEDLPACTQVCTFWNNILTEHLTCSHKQGMWPCGLCNKWDCRQELIMCTLCCNWVHKDESDYFCGCYNRQCVACPQPFTSDRCSICKKGLCVDCTYTCSTCDDLYCSCCIVQHRT